MELAETDRASAAETPATPTVRYRLRAWLAVAGLALFIAAYFALAGWFAGSAWRLLAGAPRAGDDLIWTLIGGSTAAFLAAVMLKALFFVRHGRESECLEVAEEEQPRLFTLLKELADAAGAPHPHRVFVSPRVAATVSYDLSVLNLIVPSKKNFEIGLALANALTASELRAVLAHELDSFGRRTTAVGRWVFVAQQAAAHLIARRDALDNFLQRLSRRGPPIAWVGWLLSLVVQSMRAVSEVLFRALARGLERPAGEQPLHPRQRRIATETWERALGFLAAELAAGRAVKDLFAIQSRLAEQMRTVLGRPQAPAAAPSEGSAWDLFEDAQGLRERMSAHLARHATAPAVPLEESLQRLDAQYERAYLHGHYRGVYLGRSIVRDVDQPSKLYGAVPPTASLAGELEALYPEALGEDLDRLRELQDREAQLQAQRDGMLTATERPPHDLKRALAAVRAEREDVAARIAEHDRRCRTVHLAAAMTVKSGWEDYVRALAAVLHYADHTEANVRDAQSYLHNVYAVATLDRKVSAREVRRLLAAAEELHAVLAGVHEVSHEVVLDRTLTRRLHVESWTQALTPFDLPAPTRDNLGEWLRICDSWVDTLASPLAALRLAALEQLLLAESQLARFIRERMRPGAAPPPSRVPATYPLLSPGSERKRQTRLTWWDRFQTAEGAVATTARVAVAVALIGAVLVAGSGVSGGTVTIYNGLGRAVHVAIGRSATQVPSFSYTELSLPDAERFLVEAQTPEGVLIESFEAEAQPPPARMVYNVAGASALVEWTATYGNARAEPERPLGTPRWTTTRADVLFEKPPDRLDAEGEGGTRRVLSGLGDGPPERLLALAGGDEERERLIATHARWDSTDSRYIWQWLGLASTQDGFAELLAARQKESPYDALLLRVEQDSAGVFERAAICDRHRSLAASAPEHPQLQYIAARCIEDAGAKDQAFLALQRRWPNNGWIALAVGYTYTQSEQWSAALPRLERALVTVPPFAEMLALDVARLRRAVTPSGSAAYADLLEHSEQLLNYLSLETGQGLGADHPLLGYRELAVGRLEEAIARVSGSRAEAPRLLRLAAASDGATPAMVEQALALSPESGIDADSVWAALGLAAREKRDTAPYVDFARKSVPHDADAALAFVERARTAPAKELLAAEKLLGDILPETRGHAYAAAVVILGERAPAKWRDLAKRLLFAAERPFFE